MFNTIRKHSKAIVWLIVMAFIFWGASSLLVSQSKSTSFTGEVFGKRVSHKEYNDTYKMLNLFMDAQVLAQSNLESEIWFHLALKRKAEESKIPVLDEEVRQEILRSFGGRQGFDAVRYEQWIRNVLRENPRHFEEMVRNFIRIQKLIRQVMSQETMEVTDQEIEKRHEEEKSGDPLNAERRTDLRRKILEEKRNARFAEWTREFLAQAGIKKF